MSLEIIGAFSLALAIGVLLGSLGSGGAILTLPVLVYLAKFPAHTAVPMSLIIVGSTSAVAAFLKWRAHRVHPKAVLFLGSAGIIGAYFGSMFTQLLSERALMLIFSGLMMIVSVAMFRRSLPSEAREVCYPIKCMAVGGGIGILTGFLGVGGGFLIVPALILFAGLETKTAIGSSLAIISINSLSGVVSHLAYTELNWSFTLIFSAVSLLGMSLGFRMAEKISSRRLQTFFAYFVLITAVVIGALNLLA